MTSLKTYKDNNLDIVRGTEGAEAIGIVTLLGLLSTGAKIIVEAKTVFGFITGIKKALPTGLIDEINNEVYGYICCNPDGDEIVRMGYKSFKTNQWVYMVDNQPSQKAAKKALWNLLNQSNKKLVQI